MNWSLRLEEVIGKENLNKFKNIHILIVGIGGVGGICLEMLARCGISYITICDYDKFEESNLNRQILCLNSNIGKYKTIVAKERINNINSDIKVNIINKKIDEDILNNLSNIDYIIDACDDINAKVLLVKYALNNNIKIISCCGTGNRINPSKLEITNIWKTSYDPLAKKLRHYLRKENINYKLPVVSSKEQPIIKTNRYVGSISLVPNAAGILLASYVINDIIKEN